MASNRLIIGITGASGVIYGVRTLLHLRDADVETHLVLSEGGRENIDIETDYSVDEVMHLADHVHDPHDVAAPVASGSFLTRGMLVVPCSMRSLSSIANSYNDNLLVRAADVCLKEKRKLVLVVRETPLHKGHLDAMSRAADIGAHILPPIPAFYHRPKTIEDIVDQTIGKMLDYLEIPHQLYRRWEGR